METAKWILSNELNIAKKRKRHAKEEAREYGLKLEETRAAVDRADREIRELTAALALIDPPQS